MGRPFETSRLSRCAASVLVVVLVACGASNGPGASVGHPTNNVCAPSSVVRGESCPRQVIPPGDGASGDGCHSDADCKDLPGGDGRCIKNPAFGLLMPPRDRNLLAAAPEAPRQSICVYDGCHANADCGPKYRCSCGAGQGSDRNACAMLDQCLSDRDCPEDSLCTCGSGTANVCTTGNCRTDGDCSSGFTCDASHCHTPRDTCRTNQDCAASPAGFPMCSYDAAPRAWGCHPVPQVPAG